MTPQEIIGRQFHSELKMLEAAIEKCPKAVWHETSGDSPNRYWHIAYHALFYTHFYLAPSDAEFVAWELHRPDYNFLGAPPGQSTRRPVADLAYTPLQLSEYAAICHAEVDKQTAVLDLEAPSGFYWLPINKLELQLYSLRHLAHHTGQLVDRLRAYVNVGVGWVR